MAESKTVNPQLAYLNIAPDALHHQTFTSFTKIADEFLIELEAAYDHHLTKSTNDPIIQEANFYANLNDTLLMNFNPDFLVFWVDKYHVAHDAVKKELNDILGENNIFFKEFSESIGCLKHAEFIKERSTLNIIDTDSAILDIPYQYNGTTNQIVDDQTKIATLNLSKFTNAVFKQNIAHLGEPQKQEGDGTTSQQQTFTSSTKTHGLNLVVDYEHYKRMKFVITDVVRVIHDDLKDLKTALSFIENHIEDQSVFKDTIEINVEDIMVKVGFLGNKLTNTDEVTTATETLNSNRLGIDDKTIPKTVNTKTLNAKNTAQEASIHKTTIENKEVTTTNVIDNNTIKTTKKEQVSTVTTQKIENKVETPKTIPVQIAHDVKEPSESIIFEADYLAFFGSTPGDRVDVKFTSSAKVHEEGIKFFKKKKTREMFGPYYPSGMKYETKASVTMVVCKIATDNKDIVEVIAKTSPNWIPAWSYNFLAFHNEFKFTFNKNEYGMPLQSSIEVDKPARYVIASRSSVNEAERPELLLQAPGTGY